MARTAATVSVGVRPDRASIRRTEQEVKRALNSLNKLGSKGISSKAFTQPLGRITGAADEFTKSLEASNARVLAFAASAGQLYLVERAFTKLLETTIDVEKSLADINVIMNLSGKGIQKFGNSLFNVARQTGQAFKVVAESALEFSRQGLSVEKTLIRVRDAMILSRLSGMDVIAATNSITAALNTFNDAALTSTVIINKLANVDMAFAVSSEDLANSIQRSAAAATSAKVSFDELLAITTAVQQKTQRGGAVIGNSLKSIFTRLQRSRVRESLENLGITTRDMAGNMRPAMDILQQFAKTYDTLGDAAKAHAAELMGGVFQVNILKAAVSDLSKEYSIYRGALRKSVDATNEAVMRNQQLGETLHHQVQETISAVEEFAAATGKLTFGPAIERVMGIIRGIADALTVSDASSIGGKIGEGILKGIGAVMKGPGLILLGAILAKLVYNFGKFTVGAIKTFTGMNKAALEHANIQTIINNILMKNPALIAQMTANTEVQVAVETRLLALVTRRKIEMQQAAAISATIATNILPAYMAGGKGKKGGGGRKGKALGHIPNFSRQDDGARESIGAAMGGYKPGNIKRMNVAGLGSVTYNSREAVKDVPGFAQPAIIPPKGSQAGTSYRKQFKKQIGYSADKLFGGWIPNLMSAQETTLRDAFIKELSGGARFADARMKLSKLGPPEPQPSGPPMGKKFATQPDQMRRMMDSYFKQGGDVNFSQKEKVLESLAEASKRNHRASSPTGQVLNAVLGSPSMQGDLYEIDQRRKLLGAATEHGIKLDREDIKTITRDSKHGPDLKFVDDKGQDRPQVRKAFAAMLSGEGPGHEKFNATHKELSKKSAIDWKRTASIKGSQHYGRGTGFLGLASEELQKSASSGRGKWQKAGSEKMYQNWDTRKAFIGMFGQDYAHHFDDLLSDKEKKKMKKRSRPLPKGRSQGHVPSFDPLQVLTSETGMMTAGTGKGAGANILRFADKDTLKIMDNAMRPAFIEMAGNRFGPESAKAVAHNLRAPGSAVAMITAQGQGRVFEAMLASITGDTPDSKALDLKGKKLPAALTKELTTAVPGWDPSKRAEARLTEKAVKKSKTSMARKSAADLFERLVVPQYSAGKDQHGKMLGPAFIKSLDLDPNNAEKQFKEKYFASRSGRLLKGSTDVGGKPGVTGIGRVQSKFVQDMKAFAVDKGLLQNQFETKTGGFDRQAFNTKLKFLRLKNEGLIPNFGLLPPSQEFWSAAGASGYDLSGTPPTGMASGFVPNFDPLPGGISFDFDDVVQRTEGMRKEKLAQAEAKYGKGSEQYRKWTSGNIYYSNKGQGDQGALKELFQSKNAMMPMGRRLLADMDAGKINRNKASVISAAPGRQALIASLLGIGAGSVYSLQDPAVKKRFGLDDKMSVGERKARIMEGIGSRRLIDDNAKNVAGVNKYFGRKRAYQYTGGRLRAEGHVPNFAQDHVPNLLSPAFLAMRENMARASGRGLGSANYTGPAMKARALARAREQKRIAKDASNQRQVMGLQTGKHARYMQRGINPSELFQLITRKTITGRSEGMPGGGLGRYMTWTGKNPFGRGYGNTKLGESGYSATVHTQMDARKPIYFEGAGGAVRGKELIRETRRSGSRNDTGRYNSQTASGERIRGEGDYMQVAAIGKGGHPVHGITIDGKFYDWKQSDVRNSPLRKKVAEMLKADAKQSGRMESAAGAAHWLTGKGTYRKGYKEYGKDVTGLSAPRTEHHTSNWGMHMLNQKAAEMTIKKFGSEAAMSASSNAGGKAGQAHAYYMRILEKAQAGGKWRNLPVVQPLTKFSQGHIPNLNPLGAAIGREMSAGYSSSQVKVGFDSRLRKSGGVGVYNTSEGTLSNAINIHRRQGKSMTQIQSAGAAAGYTPNFEPFTTARKGRAGERHSPIIVKDSAKAFTKSLNFNARKLHEFGKVLDKAKNMGSMNAEQQKRVAKTLRDLRKSVPTKELGKFDRIVRDATKNTKKTTSAQRRFRAQLTAQLPTLAATKVPGTVGSGVDTPATAKVTARSGVLPSGGAAAGKVYTETERLRMGKTGFEKSKTGAFSKAMQGGAGMALMFGAPMIGEMVGSLVGPKGSQKAAAVGSLVSTVAIQGMVAGMILGNPGIKAALFGTGAVFGDDGKMTSKAKKPTWAGARKGAATGTRAGARTATTAALKRGVGKVASRFIPYAGWALLAYDVYDFYQDWTNTSAAISAAAQDAATSMTSSSQSLENLLQATGKFRETAKQYGGATANPAVLDAQMNMASAMGKFDSSFSEKWRKKLEGGVEFGEFEAAAAREQSRAVLRGNPAITRNIMQNAIKGEKLEKASGRTATAEMMTGQLQTNFRSIINALDFSKPGGSAEQEATDRANFVNTTMMAAGSNYDKLLQLLQHRATGQNDLVERIGKMKRVGAGFTTLGDNMDVDATTGNAVNSLVEALRGKSEAHLFDPDKITGEFLKALQLAAAAGKNFAAKLRDFGHFGSIFQQMSFDMAEFQERLQTANKIRHGRIDTAVKLADIREGGAEKMTGLYGTDEAKLRFNQSSSRRSVLVNQKAQNEKNKLELNTQISGAFMTFSQAIGSRAMGKQEMMFSKGKLIKKQQLAEKMMVLGEGAGAGQMDRVTIQKEIDSLVFDAAAEQRAYGSGRGAEAKSMASDYRKAAESLKRALASFDGNARTIEDNAKTQRLIIQEQTRQQKNFLDELKKINLFGGFDANATGTSLDRAASAFKVKQIATDIGGPVGDAMETKANIQLADLYKTAGFTSEDMPNREQMIQNTTKNIQALYDELGITPLKGSGRSAREVAEKQFKAKYKTDEIPTVKLDPKMFEAMGLGTAATVNNTAAIVALTQALVPMPTPTAVPSQQMINASTQSLATNAGSRVATYLNSLPDVNPGALASATGANLPGAIAGAGAPSLLPSPHVDADPSTVYQAGARAEPSTKIQQASSQSAARQQRLQASRNKPDENYNASAAADDAKVSSPPSDPNKPLEPSEYDATGATVLGKVPTGKVPKDPKDHGKDTFPIDKVMAEVLKLRFGVGAKGPDGKPVPFGRQPLDKITGTKMLFNEGPQRQQIDKILSGKDYDPDDPDRQKLMIRDLQEQLKSQLMHGSMSRFGPDEAGYPTHDFTPKMAEWLKTLYEKDTVKEVEAMKGQVPGQPGKPGGGAPGGKGGGKGGSTGGYPSMPEFNKLPHDIQYEFARQNINNPAIFPLLMSLSPEVRNRLLWEMAMDASDSGRASARKPSGGGGSRSGGGMTRVPKRTPARTDQSATDRRPRERYPRIPMPNIDFSTPPATSGAGGPTGTGREGEYFPPSGKGREPTPKQQPQSNNTGGAWQTPFGENKKFEGWQGRGLDWHDAGRSRYDIVKSLGRRIPKDAARSRSYRSGTLIGGSPAGVDIHGLFEQLHKNKLLYKDPKDWTKEERTLSYPGRAGGNRLGTAGGTPKTITSAELSTGQIGRLIKALVEYRRHMEKPLRRNDPGYKGDWRGNPSPRNSGWPERYLTPGEKPHSKKQSSYKGLENLDDLMFSDEDMVAAVEQGAGKYLHGSRSHLDRIAESVDIIRKTFQGEEHPVGTTDTTTTTGSGGGAGAPGTDKTLAQNVGAILRRVAKIKADFEKFKKEKGITPKPTHIAPKLAAEAAAVIGKDPRQISEMREMFKKGAENKGMPLDKFIESYNRAQETNKGPVIPKVIVDAILGKGQRGGTGDVVTADGLTTDSGGRRSSNGFNRHMDDRGKEWDGNPRKTLPDGTVVNRFDYANAQKAGEGKKFLETARKEAINEPELREARRVRANKERVAAEIAKEADSVQLPPSRVKLPVQPKPEVVLDKKELDRQYEEYKDNFPTPEEQKTGGKVTRSKGGNTRTDLRTGVPVSRKEWEIKKLLQMNAERLRRDQPQAFDDGGVAFELEAFADAPPDTRPTKDELDKLYKDYADKHTAGNAQPREVWEKRLYPRGAKPNPTPAEKAEASMLESAASLTYPGAAYVPSGKGDVRRTIPTQDVTPKAKDLPDAGPPVEIPPSNRFSMNAMGWNLTQDNKRGVGFETVEELLARGVQPDDEAYFQKQKKARRKYTRGEAITSISGDLKGLMARDTKGDVGKIDPEVIGKIYKHLARFTATDSINERYEVERRLNDVQANYSQNILLSNIGEEHKLKLMDKLAEANKKIITDGIPLSQALKAMDSAAQKAALSVTALEYDAGDMTADQLRAQIKTTNEAAIREGTYGVKNMLHSVMGEMEYNMHDFWMSVDEDLRYVTASLREGITDSLFQAIKDTKKFGDAMSQVLEQIGDQLMKRSLQRTVNMFVDALINAAGGAAGGGRYFAGGGMVTGGSGVKDDVPAVLQGGEFVMRKSAVDKYGQDFMASLNAGGSRYAEGGMVGGAPRKGIYMKDYYGRIEKTEDEDERILGGSTPISPTDRARQVLAEKIISEKGVQSSYIERPRGASVELANEFLLDDAKKPGMGVLNTDPRLSALALQDEDNPQNALRDELEGALNDYFNEHVQHQADYQKQLKDWRKQRKNRARNMMIAAVVQIGMHAVSTALMNVGNNMRANAAKKSHARIQDGTATKADYDRLGNWYQRNGMNKAGENMKFTGEMLEKGYTKEQIGVLSQHGNQALMPAPHGGGGGGLAAELKGMDVRGDWGDNLGSDMYGNKGMDSWVNSTGKTSGMGEPAQKGIWKNITHDPISQQDLGWKTFFGGARGPEGRHAFTPYTTGRKAGVKNRATGGIMRGGDNIPSLLTDGEYVINKESVGKYGVDFFEALNANRYKEGGYVGEGKTQAPAIGTGIAGESTNNINITVNVDKNGSALTSVGSSSKGGSVSEEQKARQLAEKVNSAVISTIIEQKRPGGLLYD